MQSPSAGAVRVELLPTPSPEEMLAEFDGVAEDLPAEMAELLTITSKTIPDDCGILQNHGHTRSFGMVVYCAPSDRRMLRASSSFTSECRGIASMTPVTGLIQSEWEPPSRFK